MSINQKRDRVLALLQRLAAAAPPMHPDADGDEPDSELDGEDLRSLIELTGSDGRGGAASHAALWSAIWSRAADAGVAAEERVACSEVSRSLESKMRGLRKDQASAAMAAVGYGRLLATPGCPFFSLFSAIPMEALLRVLRTLAKVDGAVGPVNSGKGRGRQQKQSQVEDDGDDEAEGADKAALPEDVRREYAASLIQSLATVLQEYPLKDQTETLRSIIDTLTAVVGIEEPGRERGRASLPEMCLLALHHVFVPQHGPVAANAALAFMRLTPTFFQSSATRANSLAFMRESLKRSSEVARAVACMARKLCMECPDRADPRAAAVDTSMSLLKALGNADHVGEFARFLLQLSRNTKINWRVLALEMSSGLLLNFEDPFAPPAAMDTPPEPVHTAATENDEEEADEMSDGEGDTEAAPPALRREIRNPPSTTPPAEAWGVTCLRAMVHRCTDKAPSVRSKALQCLAGVLEHCRQGPHCQDVMQVLGLCPGGCVVRADWKEVAERCAEDEKALVRKAAVQVVAQVALATGELARTDADVVTAAAADALLSVRRQAIVAASLLLSQFPQDPTAVHVWLETVLPLATDVEVALQERCMELFQEQLLTRLEVAGKEAKKQKSEGRAAEGSVPDAVTCVLPLLEALAATTSADKCIQRLMSVLAKKGVLRKSLVLSLQSLVEVGLSEPATQSLWLLLAELAVHCTEGVTWEFLHAQWETSLRADSTPHANLLLRTIAAAASRFPAATAAQLADKLLEALKSLQLPPSSAAAHIAALANLCKHKSASAAEAEAVISGWSTLLLECAARPLAEFVIPEAAQEGGCEGVDPPGETRMVAALFVVGEVVALTQKPVPAQLLTFTQALLQGRLDLPSRDGIPAQVLQVPGPVRAHAWIALGKLCLVDEALAKKTLPFFVQELQRCEAAAVRNNILMALVDLCTRYTGLVEPHVGRLAACLRDPCALLRRHALLLLATLLSRDFLKWRGLLFHRFLLALVDEDLSIRQLAEYLLGDALTTKAPLLAYNHFVEAIFMLNDCRWHPSYTTTGVGAGAPEQERVLFSLVGPDPEMRRKRHVVFESLARRMTAEHKLATVAKITQEIFTGVVDETLPFAPCAEVVYDALVIVGMKEMKVSSSRNQDDDAVEDDPNAAALASARGALVSSIMKKNLMENVVPVFIELKQLLAAKHSPLTGTLMHTLRTLLKDYKNEVEDILAADKQLAKELLYDIQQAELAEKAAAEAEAEAEAANAHIPAQGPTPAEVEEPAHVVVKAEAPEAGVDVTANTPQSPHATPSSPSPSAQLPLSGVDPASTPSAAQVLSSARAGRRVSGTNQEELTVPRVRPTPAVRDSENIAPSQATMSNHLVLRSPMDEPARRPWNIHTPEKLVKIEDGEVGLKASGKTRDSQSSKKNGKKRGRKAKA